jgi:pimeloyl-ACP methyl ester carboxylesterase
MELSEKTLDRPGCRIHYWLSRAEHRPWIFLLHGAGADHRMFTDQISVLADHYNLLVWDARGHGLSRPMNGDFSIRLLVEDLLAVMAREGIEHPTLIGQSMGGNVAQEAVFLHPELFDRLVLIDTGRNTMKLTAYEKWLIDITPALMRLYPWKTLMRQSVEVSALKPEVRAYLTEVFGMVGKDDFTRIFLATTACLHEEPGYCINKPILMVVGEQDGTGNIRKVAPGWAAGEPQCEFHWIKDAGHCSNQDQPEEFNHLMLDFLRRTEVKEGA